MSARLGVLLSVVFALAMISLGYTGPTERERAEAAVAALGEEARR